MTGEVGVDDMVGDDADAKEAEAEEAEEAEERWHTALSRQR